jgi:lysyl-tRNA synthetase class II
MLDKKLDNLDKEIKILRTRIESGGPQMHIMCENLESVMRNLKVFDQKRHKTEDLETDLNRRFEALVVSLEKITKVLKENGLV